jgi:Protein of unknown function (DUF3224)
VFLSIYAMKYYHPMNKPHRLKSALLVFGSALALGASAGAPGGDKDLIHATGTFEVKIQPLPAEDKPSQAAIAKMSLEKQFHGDLEATSQGAMLATGSASGNGAYVALEVVTGKLKGHEGSFVLQHTGLATKGSASQLHIVVVPNSGTGELRGLSGTMNIIIAKDKHSYDLEYSLPGNP